MCKFKKFISIALIVSILICSSYLSSFRYVTAFNNEIPSDGNEVEVALNYTLTTYFGSRTMDDTDLILAAINNITNPGMPEDEIKRMNSWKEQGIESISNSFTVDYFEVSDYLGTAYVTENIIYSFSDETENQYVTHYIEFAYDGNGVIIFMDGYAEPFINFESCSYLPDYFLSLTSNSYGNETATNDHANTGDYAYDVTRIALTQVGYLEKATESQLYDKTANAGGNNYTKYNYELGIGNSAWCATFLAWCAREAGLEIGNRVNQNYQGTAIPFEPSAPRMRRYYQGCGRYYSRSSHTPQIGDIFFMLNEDGTDVGHVGFVYDVTSTSLSVVHGNSSQRVKCSTYPLDNTSIVAYASPDYPTLESAHNYPSTEHTTSTSHQCDYCGKVSDFSWVHNHDTQIRNMTHICALCDYSTTSTWEVDHDESLEHTCSLCDYAITGVWEDDHLVSMAHECSVCAYYKDGNWIEDHASNSMEHTCDLCGYEAIGSWYGRHDRSDTHSCTLCGSTENSPAIVRQYEHNSNYHWQKCTICNYAWTQSNHIWRAATVGYDCTICGRHQHTINSTNSCQHPNLTN